MSNKLHEGKTFNKVNYANKQLINNEFSNCHFVDCDFSKSNFSQIDFVDCEFESCNFSLTILKYTGLKDVHFRDCKIVGVDFSACNDFLFAVCCPFYRLQPGLCHLSFQENEEYPFYKFHHQRS